MMRLNRLFMLSLFVAAVVAGGAVAQDVKLDARQPIEITSNALEVLQNEQQAIFIGEVVAVQGDMRITSDRMKVFYRTGEQTQGEAQAISRIEVHGNVFMASPTENARSKTGVYNVDRNVLTLHGDVVLTRGENVVKGESLEYDLTTGKSRVVGAAATTGGSAQGAEGAGKGRVRGLFVPGSNAD